MCVRVFFALWMLVLPTALSAQTICVDPGHGGDDPGAVGCGLNEKDINLDTGLRLRDLLQGAGFTALMTRDTDVFIPLSGRADYANANGADRFVSIHANANAGTPATGTETYCATNAASNAIDLRDKIQAEMIIAWGLADRGGKTANFTVLTATAMPATLSELGFVNNCTVDATYLSDPDHLQEAAAAHLRAIQLHYGQNPTDLGTARGSVFEDQGQGADDMSIRLAGAQVTVLETGDSALAEGVDALWSFTLPPGAYTLQASLDGYQTNSRNCQVAVNATVWCSVGLFPEQGQEDAGVDAGADAGVDAGEVDAGENDAGENDAGQDDGGATDGGGHSMEPDEGCDCASGGSSSGLMVGLMLAAGLGLWAGRRRLVIAAILFATLASMQAKAGDLEIQDATPLLKGAFTAPVLSPDGRQLLFASMGLDALYLVRLEEEKPQPRLLARGPRVGFKPDWSADGRRVLLRDPMRPFAAKPSWIDLNGEQLGQAPLAWPLRVEQEDDAIWMVGPLGRQRLDPGRDRYFAPRLSPHGRYLVFEGLVSGLHLLRLKDGRLFSLGAGHHPAFGGPDDGLLVFDQSRDDGHRITAGELFVCRLSDTDPGCQPLTHGTPSIEQHPSLSADGLRLSYVTEDGQLWLARLAKTRK